MSGMSSAGSRSGGIVKGKTASRDRACLDRCMQIAVRGGDHAHADPNRRASPDSLELTLARFAFQACSFNHSDISPL